MAPPYIISMVKGANEALSALAVFRTPGQWGGGINKEFDAILDKIAKAKEEADFKAGLQEAARYALQHAYYIPVVSPGWAVFWGSKSEFDGFKYGIGTIEFYLNDVKKVK